MRSVHDARLWGLLFALTILVGWTIYALEVLG